MTYTENLHQFPCFFLPRNTLFQTGEKAAGPELLTIQAPRVRLRATQIDNIDYHDYSSPVFIVGYRLIG